MQSHYATNVFGVCNIARAAAPYLRASAASGSLTSLSNFGSLGSYRSYAATAHYCSTKAAVLNLTEGLAEELAPFGISVTCIEPGYTRTEFLSQRDDGKERRVLARRELGVYETGPVKDTKDAMESANGKQPGDVEKMARVIVDVLTREGVGEGREIPLHLPLGADTIATVRERMEKMLKMVREWEVVANATAHDA